MEIQQMVDELDRAAMPWRFTLGDKGEISRNTLQERSTALWAALRGEGGHEVAQALLAALWGAGAPPASWWRSPLGRAIGRALPEDVALTNQVAADILGVSRGSVSVLVKRASAGGSGLDQVEVARPVRPGRPSLHNQVSLRSVLARLDRLDK